jgi:signal transduction histidine kinase
LGGFSDLGVIDASGRQQTYVGPHNLEGKNYSDQAWFQEVVEKGHCISDVFMGYRQIPHLVIAVRHDLPENAFYVLRASVNLERFKQLFSQLEIMGGGSAIIVNREGILQTPCKQCDLDALEKVPFPVPAFSPHTQVLEETVDGETLVIGYAYLLDTPFILLAIKDKETLMQPWYATRRQIIGFLGLSVFFILVVVVGMATYLVNNIYTADRRRVMALHEVEYSNKMASIGRMAAGVAHEINNPLQIIYEKAGLIKDFFTFKPEYKDDPRLLALVASILSSVERCGAITKRVLSFARHQESALQPVRIKRILEDVLGFVNKEAEYRSIAVTLDVDDAIPEFPSDRGKLQQVFLNLINNAFSFISEGGGLTVTAKRKNKQWVAVFFADTGPGIPAKNLDRVFEPFFTTRSTKGGTGLGLSITYNLVQELGGRIRAESELGKGSTFIVTLPLNPHKKET